MIKLDQVSKIYKGKSETIALNQVTAEIKEHSIVGLIGANGAGKSTLMRIIAKHCQPTSGNVSLKQNYEHYSNISFLSDQEKLIENYSLKELYKMMPEFYKDFNIDLARKVSSVLEINEKKNYSKLSKGQKGKVNLVLSLASRAYITLLDETHISLDAPSRKKFFDLLLEDYHDHPRTYLISTHYVDEISQLFDDIIVLDHGELIVHESKDLIEEKSLTVFGNTELGEELLKPFNIIHRDVIGKRTFFSVFDDLSSIENKLHSSDFEISITPLEKWFIQLVESKGGHYAS